MPPSRSPGEAPAALTSFVGRTQELAALRALLGEARLLTLAGPGGIGKTRLALALLQAVDKPPPICWVDLGDVVEPEQVARCIASAAGLSYSQTERATAERLREHFADPRAEALLVLDSCEHLVDACAELVEDLLCRCPRLRVLVTSRQSLGIPGEFAWRVPSLGRPEALQLLTERARAVQPGFQLSATAAEAAQQVCGHLDGIPLAIELAAARLNVLTVEQIAERLAAHLRVLGGAARTAVPRQRTLEATLDWSYEQLLDEGERTMFRRLAAFNGSFTFEAVEAVCGDLTARIDVLDALAQLVDKSFVQVETPGASARYRLLGPIREYALVKLRAAAEELATRQSHSNWYAGLVQRIAQAWSEHQQTQLLDELEANLDNIRAVLRLYVERDEAGLALGLLDALWFYFNVRGHLGEWRQFLRTCVALPSASGAPAARARALNAIGYVALAQGDVAQARAAHEEALAIAHDQGCLPDVSITALRRIGLARRLEGDMTGAVASLEAGLAEADRHGDSRATFLTQYILAETLRAQGDDARAIAEYRESLARMRAAGDAWHAAQALLGLGYALADVGELAAAEGAMHESLAGFRRFDDRRLIAGALDGCAYLASLAGDAERAAYLLGAARALRDAVRSAPDPLLQHENARAERIARTRLGEAAFSQAAERGRSQSLDASVRLVMAGTPPVGPAPLPRLRQAGLTPRELDVAQLLVRGLSNRAIATELVISEQTAETHVKRILSKLGVASRAQVPAAAQH